MTKLNGILAVHTRSRSFRCYLSKWPDGMERQLQDGVKVKRDGNTFILAHNLHTAPIMDTTCIHPDIKLVIQPVAVIL